LGQNSANFKEAIFMDGPATGRKINQVSKLKAECRKLKAKTSGK